MRTAPAAVCAAFACAACSPAGGARVLGYSPILKPVDIVAVAPVEIRYQGDLLEREKRTEDVLHVLWADSGWAALTHHEFTVYDPRLTEPMRNTDVLLRMKAFQLGTGGFATLRTSISAREAAGSATVQGMKGKAQSYQGELVVTMALLAANGATIVEVEDVVPFDPFLERPDWDSRPEARAALVEAARALIAQCSSCVKEQARVDIDAYPTPAVFLSAPDATPSLGGEVERDLVIWHLLQYFDPEITLESSRAIAKLPRGFIVTRAGSVFERGDCVLSVGSEPAPSPHVMRRNRALRGPEVPLALSILPEKGAARTALAP